MPPKKAPNVSKAEVAKKQKAVEDKTFGLKNKNKSAKVQKHVQHLKQGVENAKKQAGVSDVKDAMKKKKEAEAARDRELNEIFKVAIQQPKVPLGVDPKSIVCEYYRQGQCTKGFKCKFSHDLGVERKTAKIDLYSDQRDSNEDGNMEDWDQEKLEQVVASKGAEYQNHNRPTEIVCKYFLEAVEKKQYGWFWACPNGGKDCQYRHALPPGYMLKSQMKALLEEESANKLTIEEEIEHKRHEIKASTPLTGELFMEWKRKKALKKEEEMAAKRADRAKQDRMSGRELFSMDASLFVDDEDGFAQYERDDKGEDDDNIFDASKNIAGITEGNSVLEVPKGNGAGPSADVKLTEEDENMLAGDDDQLFDDDDDLDEDEMEQLEASIAKTALQDD